MTSIVVHNATVDIPIFDNTSRSLKKAALGYSTGGVLGRTENKALIVRALSNINLDLKSEDRLGLIGHNGAGKSTLLRVLAGIYEPTEGTVKICGKVAAMFEMGLGINNEATGFDNIRMGGLYLGMSLKEIDAKLPDIAAFSELSDFLNLPVRTYSLGMRARLAFSLVTSVDPEILIIDEGISAGDAEFMQKAQHRLLALVERSNILVLASHQLALITQLCTQCAILEHGQIVQMGPTKDVVQEYSERTQQPGSIVLDHREFVPQPLESLELQSGSNLSTHEGNAVLTTLAQQWAYAAIAPMPLPDHAAGPGVVHVRLQVEQGKLGIGVLARGNISQMLAEHAVDVTDDPIDIDIEFADVSKAESIVFRSWSPNGVSVRARILSIETTLESEPQQSSSVIP